MSKRIGIGEGYALAFGLKWQALDPLDPSGYARKEMMAQGMLWEATFKVDDTHYLGTTKDDFSPLKGIKTLAGAGQIALHPSLLGKTALVIMEEPGEDGREGEAAIVGLLNGNVIIDEYITVDAFIGILDEFDRRCSKAGKSFIRVGKTIKLPSVTTTYSWADFRPTRGKGILGRFVSTRTVPVKPLEPVISKRALAIIASISLMFLCIWIYTDHQESKKIEERKKLEKQRNDAPSLYRSSVNEYLEKEVVPANTVFRNLRHNLNGFPTTVAGWSLKQIDCGNEGTCIATWDNSSSLANFKDFVKEAKTEWGEVSLSNDGVKITHELPIELKRKKLESPDKWIEQRTFLLGAFSKWQKYWVIGFRPAIAASPTLMAIPAGVNPEALGQLDYAIWAYKWTIDSTPWYLSEGFDNDDVIEARIPDSLTVDKVTISLDKDKHVIFKAEGLIHVRK